MEVKFSALKGHIDCKIPVVNSKVNPFIDSLKETKNKTEKPKNNNIEVLKVNIRFLQKEPLAKNNLINFMMETQTVTLEAINNLKENPQAQQELSNITYK